MSHMNNVKYRLLGAALLTCASVSQTNAQPCADSGFVWSDTYGLCASTERLTLGFRENFSQAFLDSFAASKHLVLIRWAHLHLPTAQYSIDRIAVSRDTTAEMYGHHLAYMYPSVILYATPDLIIPLAPDQIIESAPEATSAPISVSPNPSNAGAQILINVVDSREAVTVQVYDASGRLARSIAERWYGCPGLNILLWDGRDSFGRELASGVYLVRLTTPTRSATHRVTMVR